MNGKAKLKNLEKRLFTITSKISNCIGDYPQINIELHQAYDFIEKARQEIETAVNTYNNK